MKALGGQVLNNWWEKRRCFDGLTLTVGATVTGFVLRRRRETLTGHAPWGGTCRSGWWSSRRTPWVGPARSQFLRRCPHLRGPHRSPKLRRRSPSWPASWPGPASSSRTRPEPTATFSWATGFSWFGSWVRVWSSTSRTYPSRFGCSQAPPGSAFSDPTRLASCSPSSSNSLSHPCTRWRWCLPSPPSLTLLLLLLLLFVFFSYEERQRTAMGVGE